MDKIKLAGIVILYNPTNEQIKNIKKSLVFLDKIYVVDNSSQEHLIGQNDNIVYYNKKENMGVAKALNIGCQLAIKDGFNWLLTMDQDSVFNKETINKLCEYIEKNDMSKTYIVSPWLNTKLLEEKPKEEISHPFDVMTSGSIMNLDLYEKIGGFKEWLFIDGVDIAYCYDGNRLGYRIDRLNNVCIDHTLGDIKIHKILWKTFLCTNHNYIRKYYMQRNYCYLREEYKNDGYNFDNMPIAFKGIIFRIIFFEDDKIRKIRNVIRGRRDYKKGIKGKYPYKN